jgi:hypothetical protein
MFACDFDSVTNTNRGKERKSAQLLQPITHSFRHDGKTREAKTR